MNLESINKWLDEEYGVSYTRLEELHDFVVEQDLKHREKADKEINRLNNIINDKKERTEIAIRLLIKLFGTDDYEINYIMGILNGDRQIKFDKELKEGNNETKKEC